MNATKPIAKEAVIINAKNLAAPATRIANDPKKSVIEDSTKTIIDLLSPKLINYYEIGRASCRERV